MKPAYHDQSSLANLQEQIGIYIYSPNTEKIQVRRVQLFRDKPLKLNLRSLPKYDNRHKISERKEVFLLNLLQHL
jgi:hypothetical protein